MNYLYFIFSPSKNKIYVGVTSNLEERLQKHNNHTYSKAYSKMASDWEYVLKKGFTNKEDALFLERFIKKMKSRKFIEKIINKPDILNDILANNK